MELVSHIFVFMVFISAENFGILQLREYIDDTEDYINIQVFFD